jgi:lysozyme family protein
MSLEQALAFTLKEEGGFVDNPHDHGGATNHGVTQREYSAWRGAKGLPAQSVELITDAETHQLYLEDYWTPAHCGNLPDAVAIVHFDWCVNHGVRGAIKTLQAAAGVTSDGIFGPATAAAIAAMDVAALVAQYQRFRDAWYYADVQKDPSQQVFKKGWLDRVTRLTNYLMSLGLIPA